MAIYHLSIKIISRGKGKSAVAAAAYRAGEKITNGYDGIIHDYTRKGGVIHTEILLPDNAPPEYSDRAVLWNSVEKSERYKTAQLSREIELALPKELTHMQNRSLVREYVKTNFVEKGMCADIAIHDSGNENPHAHIMLTMRPIEQNGKWGQKSHTVDGQKIPTVDWNEQSKAEDWRATWAELANRYLEKLNHAERIDHRSYERQGIDKVPTIHLGVSASQMERKGIATNRGNINRDIEVTNSKLRQLKARIGKLQTWLKDEMENPEPPTLADVIQGILSRREQEGQPSRYRSISNLKAAANILNFLTSNNIMDMAGLEEKIKSMYGRQFVINDKLKRTERRLKTLDEHIKQADNYFEFKEIYEKYKQQKPKKQDAFYESHRRELMLYEYAERYLTGVMNGKTTLPTKKWKAEREALTAERSQLYREYVSLKTEVDEVYKIQRSIKDIMREEARDKQSQRPRRMDR